VQPLSSATPAHYPQGRNNWQKTAPGSPRANFDGTPTRTLLPIKKARAGHRHITGPRCLSPDNRPYFPARFTSIEHARAHCQEFFRWYNHEHRHGGLGLHTAADIHHGHATSIQAERAHVLAAAYHAHPERFVSKAPAPPDLPCASWINRPPEKEDTTQ
jgi:transposase InsO family protein